MAKFKKGDKVAQVVPRFIGEVKGFSVDQESGEVLTMVEMVDEDGTVHQRGFTDAQLEAAPAKEEGNA